MSNRVFSYIQSQKSPLMDVPATISRKELEDTLEPLSAGFFKRDLVYVGEVRNSGNEVSISSLTFCYPGLRDRITKDTELAIEYLMEEYGQVSDGTKFYYDSNGGIMGYKVPDDTSIWVLEGNENYITNFDDVVAYIQFIHKIVGKHVPFCFCGKLYCTPDTNLVQALTGYIAYKLTETSFTRDFVLIPDESPTIIGAQLMVFLVYDQYFTSFTKSKTLDEIEGILTYLVGGMIASGIFVEFVHADYEAIIKEMTFSSTFLRDKKIEDTTSVTYTKYVEQFEELHKTYKYIHIIPPLQMYFDGITLESEFIKEILVSTETHEFILDLGYPMADRARKVVEDSIKARFNCINDVTIYIPNLKD